MDYFFNLPTPVRFVLGALTCTTILGVVEMLDSRLVGIVFIGGVVLAGALTGYYFLLRWLQRKKAASMTGEIRQHSAAAPNAINDAGKRAKLDDLKRSFEVGLEKFRTAGKDVYNLPWYLIVGEPGAGKTEAVRHCNVGFPPGLQEMTQGVGGTINMNWWFTNQAVLLDTAGRLMFEEVKPGEASEWREFLQLLNRNRPNCPINGLLLIIPVNSLILDGPDQIASKAGRIAQQLDTIQRTLDVRFPVFVLITKCDLVDGFREFFENMETPETQHQMLGWSNPDPIDSVFRPDMVDQHLKVVVERIRKRRLGLLRDPIAQKEGGRRTDEMDSLFCLPESFGLIAPKLRSYLEQIFVAGPWSAKPLFLRGIYFTSSMREGSALDQVLARELGVSVKDLPEGGGWERERAYFLRDIFMDKVFPERGLVTRATNTGTLLRKRKLLLYGFGFIGMAVLLAFSLLEYNQFKESIGTQSRLWSYGTLPDEWRPPGAGTWHPLVERAGDKAGAAYQYMGDQQLMDSGMRLAEYHEKLRQLCDQDINIGWVFRPLARFFRIEGDRRRAQEVLFSGGVVKSLVEAVRRRMIEDSGAPAAGGELPSTLALREAEALAALIRIESDAARPGADVRQSADLILPASLRFVTGLSEPGDPQGIKSLSDTLVWTYSPPNPSTTWPPNWISRGKTLPENQPIRAGLDRLFVYAGESADAEVNSLAALKTIETDLEDFLSREKALNDESISEQDQAAVATEMENRYAALASVKKKLDDEVRAAADSGQLLEYSLTKSYNSRVAASSGLCSEAFDKVENAVADYKANPALPVNADHPIFLQISKELDTRRKEMEGTVANSFTADEQKALPELDKLLADFGDGRRVYEERWNQYETAHAAFQGTPEIPKRLMGTNWEALAAITDAFSGLRAAAKPVIGRLGGDFTARDYYLDHGEKRQIDAVLDQYIVESKATFEDSFFFPLVSEESRHGNMRKELEAEREYLDEWDRDSKSEHLAGVASPKIDRLKLFWDDVHKLAAHLGAAETRATVSLVAYDAVPESDRRGLDYWHWVILGGDKRPSASADGIELGTFSIFDSVSVEFETFSETNAGSTQRDGGSWSVKKLVMEARRGGGDKVEESVGNFPIWLEVKCDGEVPDESTLPKKESILADLQ
jgi:hypothetical protein